MNAVTLGIRNAFRNATRTLSIIVILGLSIGLSMVMLIAHQAVEDKIKSVKTSLGNTVTIEPAGYTGFSSVNNALTTPQLNKVKLLPHVTNLTETLNDHVSTTGSSQPQGLAVQSSGSNATTSIKSAVKLNSDTNNGMKTESGGGLFLAGGGQLPTNFSPPVGVIGSSQPVNVATFNGLASSLKIRSGKAINGSKDTNDAMISTSLASTNNLKVGSTFTAYGKTLTIAAIYDSGSDSGNNNIVVSLPTEQRLSGQSSDVTMGIATVDSLDNLSSATSAIKNTLGSSADVTSSIAQANQALQPLNSVKNVSLYSLAGAVIAGGIIILMTMIMIVRERRREIGILKAIGGSNVRIIFQFMSEALTLTVLGAVVGLVIGIVGGNPVTSTLVSNSGNSSNNPLQGGAESIARNFANPTLNTTGIKDVHAQIGWSVLLYGLGAALLIAVIGSSFAGWMIAKVRPSEVMRAE
jgi:putative ABC transport system permease protein